MTHNQFSAKTQLPEPEGESEERYSAARESANESKLRAGIAFAINCVSAENGSNTPDFILADYLANCLKAFDAAVTWREKWYGRGPAPCEPPSGVGDSQPDSR